MARCSCLRTTFAITYLSNFKILLITVIQMPCLQIGGLRTHEMGELESDRLIVLLPGGRFELHTQLVELDREELDRHIPVKRFGIRPALDTVLIRHLLIDTEKASNSS